MGRKSIDKEQKKREAKQEIERMEKDD